jgi:HK97 family phage prohead protease
MRHDLFFAPLEVKFATDEAAAGTFSGYGAVFGNVDAYGDVIQKGAFKDTLREWKKQKRMPPMLIQHGGWGIGDMDGLAIGKWTSMEEDDTGLAVEGKLIGLDTERGKIIHGAMREGVLDGMSIGYRAKEFSLGTKPTEPRRTLKKIDLVECSVVQMPANDAARVAQVKAAGGARTIREFEDFLRDAGGFSHAAAKAIAAGGFKASDPRDEDVEPKWGGELSRLLLKIK